MTPLRAIRALLLLTVTLGAGLVLSGCGDDDTATTPAPAPPPPPAPAPEPDPEPEPEPEAPATPANLMVSETSETSITWTWDAVEGANAYAVQQSADEMFDETDMTSVTLETTHTASDLEPETSVYLRVAAAAGTLEDHVLSGWTTHVTGMSAMPPPDPPPPPPDPLMVTFMAPDGEFPMKPRKDDTDEADAMADVNSKITVSSNTTAVIKPMFVEDANGVRLEADDDNMPFAYVDWAALQSLVVGDGAMFMVQRTTMGANQEMEPTGDVAYVTCGPFECAMGMDAPVISIDNSETCNNWQASVELDMGLVDNDVLDSGEDTTGNDTDNDGIDLGWLATSNEPMTVKHVFSGIAGGTNGSFTSEMKKKGEDVALTMQTFSTGLTADREATTTPQVAAVVACVPENGATTTDSTQGGRTYSAASRDGIYKPANCFRLEGPGSEGKATAKTKGPNWLSGYTLELTATGAGVSWGSNVDWEEDPFEEHKCPSMMVNVADELDVCSLFDEEVAQAFEEGWADPVIFWEADRVVRWSAGAKAANRNRFSTLWFDDDLDEAIKNENADRPEATAGEMSAELHDLYNNNAADDNLGVVWQLMTNTDGSPNRGDFGKVDLFSDVNNPASPNVDETTAAGNPDGNADNYDDTRAFRTIRQCSDDDGDGCDATWSDTWEVALADGTFGCTSSVEITIECTWDADGDLGVGRGVPAAATFTPGTNDARFYKCTAK